MTVPYNQPDFTSQEPTAYKTNIDGITEANNGVGGQFYVTASDTPSMVLNAESGTLSTNEQPQQQVTIGTAPTSAPRIDIVQIDSLGIASVKEDTLSPDAGKHKIAEVVVGINVTEIYGVNITDARPFSIPVDASTSVLEVSTPSTETISGTATTQQEANIESKTAVVANTESILNLTGASMKIAEFGGTFSTTEVMFDFDTITPSDNTDLLDADDTTNIVTLKKPLRYEFQTFISVISTGGGAKTLTLRVYNSGDDSLLNTRTQEVQGGNNNAQQFPLDAVLLDNPIENLEIYFTAQCTDTQLDLVELNTTIATGGGGGGGVWDVQDGEVVNIGLRPVNVIVATTGIGDVTVAGTGTAYDAIYIDTGNNDTFENPTLSDGVNTLIKDDANAFWCLASGVTIVNPDFATSQYCNFTGSIEGIYTVVLGVGVDGTATIASGGAGSQAITANADVVAPVFEITGKASRRYNFTDSYVVDTVIEPETGAAFVLMANGVARMAIPVSGVEKMMNVYRSLVLGGETDTDPNLATDINNTIYDKTFIPCNTTATGADLGVSGSAQVLGGILVGADQASGNRVILDDTSVISTDGTGTADLSLDRLEMSRTDSGDVSNFEITGVRKTEGNSALQVTNNSITTGGKDTVINSSNGDVRLTAANGSVIAPDGATTGLDVAGIEAASVKELTSREYVESKTAPKVFRSTNSATEWFELYQMEFTSQSGGFFTTKTEVEITVGDVSEDSGVRVTMTSEYGTGSGSFSICRLSARGPNGETPIGIKFLAVTDNVLKTATLYISGLPGFKDVYSHFVADSSHGFEFSYAGISVGETTPTGDLSKSISGSQIGTTTNTETFENPLTEMEISEIEADASGKVLTSREAVYAWIAALNDAEAMTWTQLGTSGVYYGKRSGMVCLRGLNTAGNSVGTLPIGFRPSTSIGIIVRVNGGGGDSTVTIGTSGAVTDGAGGGNTSFDTLSFPAEQ